MLLLVIRICALKINGVSASMEIDTGTAATIISSRQYELIKQGTHELQLSTANVPTLRTYAGQTIKPAGGVTVDVRPRGAVVCVPRGDSGGAEL